MTEHSVEVRPFLFPFTIDEYTLIYHECVKVFFVRICRVFYSSQGQTQSLVFLVCNLRPVFEKVKFNLRLSLEPFKDLDGRFDPSSTALTKRSQTLSNDRCVFRILSASVRDRFWLRKGLLLRYIALQLYTQLCCKSIFLSKGKLTDRECCMVNLLPLSINEGQLNYGNERSHLTNE